MTEYSFPSINPADSNSLSGAIKLAIRKSMQDMHNMLPAQVVAYNSGNNTATVQPLISVIDTANNQTIRVQITVPVLQMGGGGFVLLFPIKAGDLGWIKSNDRDISIFKQSKQQSAPNTERFHDFADSVFIPDNMLNGVSRGGATTDCTLQSIDGTTTIGLGEGKVTITCPTEIIMNTPLVTIAGQLVSGTNPSYTQTATFNGNITTTGDIVAGEGSSNISLQSHVHSGVTMGGSDTGIPV